MNKAAKAGLGIVALAGAGSGLNQIPVDTGVARYDTQIEALNRASQLSEKIKLSSVSFQEFNELKSLKESHVGRIKKISDLSAAEKVTKTVSGKKTKEGFVFLGPEKYSDRKGELISWVRGVSEEEMFLYPEKMIETESILNHEISKRGKLRITDKNGIKKEELFDLILNALE